MTLELPRSVTRLLDQETKDQLTFPLHWAPNFGLFSREEVVAQNPLYRQGKIIPMDPSSYLAVQNLELSPGEHVLDLCCAPGGKMILMSESLFPHPSSTEQTPKGSITGVDISRARLATAAKMMKKYQIPLVRLFRGDGTTLRPPLHALSEDRTSREGFLYTELYARKEDCPFFSSTPYRRQRGRLVTHCYDKVLVDAQCTHDGSIKHVRKHIEEGWSNYDPHHYSAEGLQDLYDLQLRLLENGFACLKPDGMLVYSTCSLSAAQNQGIVEKFLAKHSNEAVVLDPLGPDEFVIRFGSSKGLCVIPTATMGGGFFLCRIRKKASNLPPPSPGEARA